MVTTGQCARRRQARATGPMGPADCPGPGRVVPRTSISASAVRSSRARTGGSRASSVVSRPGGRRGRASSAAAASAASAAAYRSSSRVTQDHEAYDARSLVSLSHAQTTWRATRRSRASRTAQRTAAAEAADPSTPTTIGPRAFVCVMAYSPPVRGVVRLTSHQYCLPQHSTLIRGVGPVTRETVAGKPRAGRGDHWPWCRGSRGNDVGTKDGPPGGRSRDALC